MSNSPLATYTKLSPNHSGTRRAKIDNITIHHMAGNLTVEQCGNVFANPNAGASSNYGVGTDGRIGLYVDEKNRSWATSSPLNDHRSITIEVANNSGDPYWTISENAYNSLINLLVDICKRNNIPKLAWANDPSLKNQTTAKQNMTVHRWFANTNCCGPYLMSKMNNIAADVNKKLIGNKQPPVIPEGLVVYDSKSIWNFFKEKGLSETGTAGMMGNMFAESRYLPINLQDSEESYLGMNDIEYTRAVDNGTYTNFVNDGAGYGLCQWTHPYRKKQLLEFAKKQGKSIGDLNMQLNFLWDELNNAFPDVVKTLKKNHDIFTQVNKVMVDFERPYDQGSGELYRRVRYALMAYNKYATKIPYSHSVNYVIQTTGQPINIRKTPNDNGQYVQGLAQGTYTIIEESIDNKDMKWGLLKSKLGWIKLQHTKRV